MNLTHARLCIDLPANFAQSIVVTNTMFPHEIRWQAKILRDYYAKFAQHPGQVKLA